jgi:hypothetical protein
MVVEGCAGGGYMQVLADVVAVDRVNVSSREGDGEMEIVR